MGRGGEICRCIPSVSLSFSFYGLLLIIVNLWASEFTRRFLPPRAFPASANLDLPGSKKHIAWRHSSLHRISCQRNLSLSLSQPLRFRECSPFGNKINKKIQILWKEDKICCSYLFIFFFLFFSIGVQFSFVNHIYIMYCRELKKKKTNKN